ncbi:MAG TPA: BamA/TamA family outer membrane protein, partial [Candidatus Saccharimonadales bacterium]|nr:BamA/TamA family outer membrane protein [Candidatus Saccharimonadales bacterium]
SVPVPAGNLHARNPGRCSQINIGGNKMVLLNAEYVLPTVGPLDFALFLDAGRAYTERESIDLGKLKKDAGLEMRLYLPIFGAPIRLIYGFNLDREHGEPPRKFVFSIGTTF